MSSDPLTLTAAEQARAIREGRLRAADLMAATLDRIEAVNGALNAIVSMREREALLTEARAADKAEAKGPLHGLPLAVKDLADAAGLPTSHGSPAFAGQIAAEDSPHIAPLRAAGAIVIGKTNTPEFGLGSHTYNPVHGVTANPYDLTRSCGGSSGGAAVALAAGMLSIADGSDMMGSLRNPAGWSNVYGMRPSWGRVPGGAEGDVFLHRLATNGPMARCPGDLALQLDVMSVPGKVGLRGPDFAPVGALRGEAAGLRVAWLADWNGALPFEDGILPLCEAALDVLGQVGCAVDSPAAPFSREALWQSWTALRSWAVAADKSPMYEDETLRGHLKPEAIWEIEQGRALSALDVHAASVLRSDWLRAADAFFERFDVIALPTAQVWPFDKTLDWPKAIAGQGMDTYHRWMEVVVPASLLGLPAVAVPAGFGPQGLPMGLQLIGRHGDDARLLELAEAYHRATRWPETRPPTL
ncbi:amidase [Roseovarius atlanticus]|uniref:amidase n=1 Tax=Roseovarius atlanticus TaxID=1641875 RepID=UPI001C96029A|nr:amidase [Roseovarius atlanticus]MBY5988474.1 amidase [Roseovarius atlanticus]MBY6123865.1 amidase [Roseovarius atlanticus]MBY6148360.1 amidase [Roseovarius atlanticus]